MVEPEVVGVVSFSETSLSSSVAQQVFGTQGNGEDRIFELSRIYCISMYLKACRYREITGGSGILQSMQ